VKKLAYLLGCLMAFVLLVANPALAQTQTFTNPDNGHQYFLTKKSAWTDAKAEFSVGNWRKPCLHKLESR